MVSLEGTSQGNLSTLKSHILKDHGYKLDDPIIIFSSMPPIQKFPAFPPLMRFTIGNIAKLLGDELDHIVAPMDNIYYHNQDFFQKGEKPSKVTLNDINTLLCDGVHPSKQAYQLWAEALSQFITDTVTSP